jgi:hypothetical protein
VACCDYLAPLCPADACMGCAAQVLGLPPAQAHCPPSPPPQPPPAAPTAPPAFTTRCASPDQNPNPCRPAWTRALPSWHATLAASTATPPTLRTASSCSQVGIAAGGGVCVCVCVCVCVSAVGGGGGGGAAAVSQGPHLRGSRVPPASGLAGTPRLPHAHRAAGGAVPAVSANLTWHNGIVPSHPPTPPRPTFHLALLTHVHTDHPPLNPVLLQMRKPTAATFQREACWRASRPPPQTASTRPSSVRGPSMLGHVVVGVCVCVCFFGGWWERWRGGRRCFLPQSSCRSAAGPVCFFRASAFLATSPLDCPLKFSLPV